MLTCGGAAANPGGDTSKNTTMQMEVACHVILAVQELSSSGRLVANNNYQGCQNGAFGKRSFCWGDTRHFRSFSSISGVRGAKSLVFLWAECNIRIFANFRQNHLFLAGDKTTVFQNDRFDNPETSGNSLDPVDFCCWNTENLHILNRNSCQQLETQEGITKNL